MLFCVYKESDYGFIQVDNRDKEIPQVLQRKTIAPHTEWITKDPDASRIKFGAVHKAKNSDKLGPGPDRKSW